MWQSLAEQKKIYEYQLKWQKEKNGNPKGNIK
jgi:hypothetical protein